MPVQQGRRHGAPREHDCGGFVLTGPARLQRSSPRGLFCRAAAGSNLVASAPRAITKAASRNITQASGEVVRRQRGQNDIRGGRTREQNMRAFNKVETRPKWTWEIDFVMTAPGCIKSPTHPHSAIHAGRQPRPSTTAIFRARQVLRIVSTASCLLLCRFVVRGLAKRPPWYSFAKTKEGKAFLLIWQW